MVDGARYIKSIWRPQLHPSVRRGVFFKKLSGVGLSGGEVWVDSCTIILVCDEYVLRGKGWGNEESRSRSKRCWWLLE